MLGRMHATYAWYFLSPQGRITRQEFLLGYFGVSFAFFVFVRTWRNLTLPAVQYYSSPDFSPPRDHTMLLGLLIIVWPLIAIFVKRLHDLNVSGWWLLVLLAIPPVADALHINTLIPHFVIAAALSLIPGSVGDNRFGRNPLAQASV